jgi:Concanavalin A-like lectin/glucanases superfamily/Bacterial Ig domain
MTLNRRIATLFWLSFCLPVFGNIITDSLTHRYSFTSNAVDSVGGSDGVLQGGASFSNGAVVLNGTNGFVDLPDNLVTGYTAVTIEAWVTDNGSGPWARIYDFGSNTTHYMFLSLPAGPGNLRGAYNSGGGEQVVEWPGTGRPAAGQKAHLVWTSDSVSQVGALYVNGTRVGVSSNFTQTPAGLGQTPNVWLGRSQFANDPYFKGAIDEFRIYKAALSATDVQTNYQAGPDLLPTGLNGVPGVIHRWSFSEASGAALQDSLGGATGRVVVLGAVDYSMTNGGVRLAGGAKGTADYIELPAGLLHGLTNVTIEAWVTPRSFQTWARLFDFGSGVGATANTFFLSLCRGGSLNQQRFEFGAPAVFTVDTGLPTFAGQQHHYVATWGATGGAGGSGRAQWYRDGTLAGGVDVAAATLANVDDSVLWLGRSQYPDNTANADFAEVRMYNRVLTPTEINFSRVNGPDRLVVPLPNAIDDAITLNPGAMALIDVVQNDQGTLLNPNSITITTSPLAGTAQTKPGGKILYTHNGGPALSDQFGYTIKDGLGRTHCGSPTRPSRFPTHRHRFRIRRLTRFPG